MAKLLAFDTSTENCSAAIYCEGEVFQCSELVQRGHTDRILPMIDRVLKQANCPLSELDAIVFGHGPGGFTGVRIGTAVAQGLAFASSLPLIGVSTLDALAQQVRRLYPDVNYVVSALDARMQEVYLGIYALSSPLSLLSEPCVTAPDRISYQMPSEWTQGKVMGIGSGWQTYTEELKAAFPAIADYVEGYPEAIDLLSIGLEKFNRGELSSIEEAQPMYLRNEVTWQKLPGK